MAIPVASDTAEAREPTPYRLWALLRYMLALGTWGFGGPAALIGYMYRDLVERRRWISESDYKEGLALAERLIPSHWENNYGGSVKALAAVKRRLYDALGDKDIPPHIHNDLKREHLVRTGSVVFHEDYFENLGGSGKAGAGEREAIGRAFGSFDAWESEFRRIGAGLGGGSGWVVLGFNQHTQQLENYWMADRARGPAATLPILVMDMYEHSYQMDFGAAAAKYIDAFFQNIQWDKVAARLGATGASKT